MLVNICFSIGGLRCVIEIINADAIPLNHYIGLEAFSCVYQHDKLSEFLLMKIEVCDAFLHCFIKYFCDYCNS